MFILFIFMFIFITNSLEDECYYDGDDFCVSQEDILSADLLPGSFLLSSLNGNKNVKSGVQETINGTYEAAFNQMNYHRKRMNEYLCHGFMAEGIFQDMRSIRVKRRQDSTSSNSMPDFLGDENVTVHDKMLSDEGSSKYKDWLQRTTTLNDVYRHYAPKNKISKKFGQSYVHGIEEFDGEVTGYAMPAPVFPDKISPHYDSSDYVYYSPDDVISSPTGHYYSHSGPPQHHSSPHYPPPPPQHHSHHEDVAPVIHEEHHYHAPSHFEEEVEYWHKAPHHKSKGDLSIKDFFEIALTALAFLAFGLFIIQLLMSITVIIDNTKNSGTTTVVTEDPIRFRRNAPPYHSNAELNELSHRVLQSIEAIMVANSDSGRCLRWTLCRDNRYSVQTASSQRLWLPIWSLGTSWISGQILKQKTWIAMFDSIKASILGLGGSDCSALYPECDLLGERTRRRRRRRK
ncbi:GSCOCG00000340001-RA-CDS [Cotesia congregata]|nr:GSCOCG00000340001-RA-CDS [Cotesia congregata]